MRTKEALLSRLRSKPGIPMYGKNHTEKQKISLKLSQSPIGLYDLEGTLIKQYRNQFELAHEYNLNKTTISLRP